MAPHSTRTRGVFRLVISRCATWALAAGLLFWGSRLSAQEAHFSAASQIGQSCGAAFSSTTLQQEAESQLRGAGLTVSRVHTGVLATDVACVPVTAENGARAMAVHECLGLSQVVSVPGPSAAVTMATTWRQCRQYTCFGRQCGAAASNAQRELLTAFLGDYREQLAKAAAPAPVVSTPPVQQASVAAVPVSIDGLRPMLKVDVVFYGLYILACIAVLVRWQWCR